MVYIDQVVDVSTVRLHVMHFNSGVKNKPTAKLMIWQIIWQLFSLFLKTRAEYSHYSDLYLFTDINLCLHKFIKNATESTNFGHILNI